MTTKSTPRHSTGPAAQINLMGYAKATQTAHGIHMRLRARAFIVSERPHKDEQQMENKSTMDNEQAAKETETTSSSSSSSSRTKSRLRWDSLFSHNNEETTTKVSSTDEDIKSSNVAKLDPERTICFVSIDTGMVRPRRKRIREREMFLVSCFSRLFAFFFVSNIAVAVFLFIFSFPFFWKNHVRGQIY